MTDYLLDTNHISPIVTIEHPLRQRILTQLQAGDTFSIPALVLGEFLYGISLLPRATSNLREWERLKDDFVYYSITVPMRNNRPDYVCLYDNKGGS
ncbi:MAG: hypothetical protein KDI79_28435 [Anaerolineae bacterium]|nr:hypothetical protein [Anaerolineae bacterium]